MALKAGEQVLIKRIKELCDGSWRKLPSKGTGAPGHLLEKGLGIAMNNADIPDAGGWELKYSSGNSLITLFHKQLEPNTAVKALIEQFGWIGSKNNLPSFRHTIHGDSSMGFNVVSKGKKVYVTHDKMKFDPPYWTENTLLNAAGGKLRRLVLVKGKRRTLEGTPHVQFNSARLYQEFNLAGFIDAVVEGKVAVDFDAYVKDTGAVRDHGTKFRIKPENLSAMYKEAKDIAP